MIMFSMNATFVITDTVNLSDTSLLPFHCPGAYFTIMLFNIIVPPLFNGKNVFASRAKTLQFHWAF